MSRKFPRHVALTAPAPWADIVLDVRPHAEPLPAMEALPTDPECAPDRVHHAGPDGWALTRMRIPLAPAEAETSGVFAWATDVVVLHAPDGTRTALVAEAPSRFQPGQGVGQIALGLIQANAPLHYDVALPDLIWPLLPALHAALLDSPRWLRPNPTPEEAWADARLLLQWAPYGFDQAAAQRWVGATIPDGKALQRWWAVFDEEAMIAAWAPHLPPARAADWAEHTSDPIAAKTWHGMWFVPDRAKFALADLGWDPVKHEAALSRRLSSSRTRKDDAATLLTMAQVAHRHGCTSAGDTLALLDLGLTPAEAEIRLADPDFINQVRVLVALQTP